MKILFIIHSLKFGGAERQLIELAKGLSKKKYECHIACLDSYKEGYSLESAQKNIVVHNFIRKNKFDIYPVFLVYRYIIKNNINLIHTFENLGSLFGLIAGKYAGKPVVCSAIRSGRDKDFKIKISTKIIAMFADILVSNSRAGFNNRFKTIRKSFKVVYNGIDFKRFEKNNYDIREIKKNIGIVDSKKVVGMVASFSNNKDQRTLLNAATIVLKEYPETCFVLIGDGRQRKNLELLARQLNLTENVYFLGYRNDVDQLIRIFDVAVLQTNTDVIVEGLSNAIIEAMAVELPVIATEGGGTGEIIRNNINGIIVKPKSPHETAIAIKEILKNRKKAKKMGVNAKLYVKNFFNIENSVKEYEKIYKELSNKY